MAKVLGERGLGAGRGKKVRFLAEIVSIFGKSMRFLPEGINISLRLSAISTRRGEGVSTEGGCVGVSEFRGVGGGDWGGEGGVDGVRG